MATIIRKRDPLMFGGAAPFGNLTALAFTLATNATGAVVDSNSTAAVALGDVIELGLLPGGMRLDDAQVIITTAMSASVTGSLGFKYADGVDSLEAPQDAAYFISAGALSSTARLRANGTKLITLPKDAILILTIAGAAIDQVADLKFVVSGELTGPR
ncbi:hypothetical protein ACNPQK_08455 [Acinetobacter guillouiae]|uniref:hypothetical protein n=1 Tax=Acinetobacter guillouiae TaxID=106649 RepID=UPI003AF56F88